MEHSDSKHISLGKVFEISWTLTGQLVSQLLSKEQYYFKGAPLE